MGHSSFHVERNSRTVSRGARSASSVKVAGRSARKNVPSPATKARSESESAAGSPSIRPVRPMTAESLIIFSDDRVPAISPASSPSPLPSPWSALYAEQCMHPLPVSTSDKSRPVREKSRNIMLAILVRTCPPDTSVRSDVEGRDCPRHTTRASTILFASGGFAQEPRQTFEVVVRAELDHDLTGLVAFQFDLDLQPQQVTKLLFQRVDVGGLLWLLRPGFR